MGSTVKTLLVIDESAALCQSMDLLLSSYGIEVHTCRNVREARKLVDALSPDAYLMEAVPPADDVIAFVGERKVAGSCAVLLMGEGVAKADAGGLAINSGADGWVDKPFEAMIVLKRLRQIASR
ncbi:MAG: DNA-binding response OmpR family regulator [Myxococcota bacterium]|jgi:DNA-binding response OmpR family regulator